MALTSCRECKKEVSSDAKTCPHCGTKAPAAKRKPVSAGMGCLVLLLVLVVLGMIGQALRGPETAAVGTPSSAPASVPSAPAAPPDPAAAWMASEDVSPMDGSKTITLMRSAEGTVTTWTKTLTPDLVLRCKEGKVAAYVISGSPAHIVTDHLDEARVRFRVDSAVAVTQWWGESTDDEAFFAPNPRGFITAIAAGEKLVMEWTPFNSSPVQTIFDIRGLSTHLPKLKEACRWR